MCCCGFVSAVLFVCLYDCMCNCMCVVFFPCLLVRVCVRFHLFVSVRAYLRMWLRMWWFTCVDGCVCLFGVLCVCEYYHVFGCVGCVHNLLFVCVVI